MASTTRILVVDDDETLRETLAEQFALHEEFDVSESENASGAREAVRNQHVDLVLLDVNLPDQDGRETCKQIRADGFKGPVIMLTAQDSEADAIFGLESGAND